MTITKEKLAGPRTLCLYLDNLSPDASTRGGDKDHDTSLGDVI